MTKVTAVKELVFERFDVHNSHIDFHYSYDGSRYTNKLSILSSPMKGVEHISPELLDSILGNLGIAFVPYFFGLDNFTHLKVLPLNMSDEQIAFFQDYFNKGLAEFKYKNNFQLDSKISILPNKDKKLLSAIESGAETGRAILLNGGGKDSVVAAEILKALNIDFTWMVLNPTPSREENIRKSKSEEQINFKWTFDSKLKKNRKYLGHKPLSAFLGFLSVFSAIIERSEYAVAANEYSANFGTITVNGFSINHQYTKSYEFEKAFSDYVKKYLVNDIHYFSVLRPLFELQIAKLFSSYPQYHSSFVSCNKGQTKGEWCGECAKCAFVFLALYPFLTEHEMVKIFGNNLFSSRKIKSHIYSLLKDSSKPFECVGTKEESALAVLLSLEKNPDLFNETNEDKKIRTEAKKFNIETLRADIFQTRGREHNIPIKIYREQQEYLAKLL